MVHALTPPRQVDFVSTKRPFSGFDYIEGVYGDVPPVRRLFSQTRSLGVEAIVREEIDATGIIADENDEIRQIYPEYVMDRLERLTFWSVPINSVADVANAGAGKCLGYAILKQDSIPSRRW